MGRDFSKVKRIVVKVGTSSLTDKYSRLDYQKVRKIVREVMDLRKKGKEVLLVTSGAIGAGVGRLGMRKRPKELPMLQAAAAVGQGILMRVYEKYFGKYGQPIAQLLLTKEDFFDKERSKNLRNTLRVLRQWGVIPVVNENDSVAVEEIKFGDNDLLSAHLAILSEADLLVLLSDVNGLYTGDPKHDRKAKLLHEVREFTPQLERLAKGKSFGGMRTKLQAAKMACSAGIPVVVARAGERKVLERLLSGEKVGTLFLPEEKK
ncbi:MAG: glutamate 5-kinase [Candidatus Hadarchaeales archaeon]